MKLKEFRKSKYMTQGSVAKYLGISPTVYCRYESGKRRPSHDILIRLADLYGVTVDALLGRDEVKTLTLSDYETKLIEAYRNADERAREDVLCLLRFHAVKPKAEDQ